MTAVMAGFAVAVAIRNGEAQEHRTAVTCTNPVSGASWQITIDYRNASVDSNPAEITRTAISWFDPKDGGNYTLDLRSGALTAIVASSTGGYFRRARCSLEKSR
jgi:alkyl sulfatase BDS1-like metallo-beta-lactamase superfamily hydrolase